MYKLLCYLTKKLKEIECISFVSEHGKTLGLSEWTFGLTYVDMYIIYIE